jgi:putative hemolysin
MEILVIAFLILLNGLFAMSELAIVSSRKTRLQQWAEEEQRGAQIALQLANEPGHFLSTVQVGITSIAILSGALGEAVLAEDIARWLSNVPVLASYSQEIALGLVVVLVTYLSVVFGELVPKRVALHNPERIAVLVARPLQWLAEASAPVVRVLSWSSDVVLRLLGLRESRELPVTDEEINVLMEQGTEAGVFESGEQTLVSNILRLDEQRITAIMTPRMEIVHLDLEWSYEENRDELIRNPHSRLPVTRGGLEDVAGILDIKDVLARSLRGEAIDFAALLRPALYVPESISPIQLLETFKKTRNHLALIVDEFGDIDGLVTMTDVLGAIVGDIPYGEVAEESQAVRREDGSWLLDGMLSIDKFKELFDVEELPGEESGAFNTLGGWVMAQLGKVPRIAERFDWEGMRFEVMDMDRNRVDKVLAIPSRPALNAQAELPPEAP